VIFWLNAQVIHAGQIQFPPSEAALISRHRGVHVLLL